MIVGGLGASGRAEVDDRGRIQVHGEAWALDWWIGADDRWRIPATEDALRTTTVGAAPVSEIRLRVPAGDAVQRAYGVGGAEGLVIVEIENDSPAAFVVAATISGARAIAVDGSTVLVDGVPRVVLPTVPPRWSAGTTALTPDTIGASTGPFPPVQDRRGQLVAAFLVPLSHRNRLRIGVVTGSMGPAVPELVAAPDAEAAARGWTAVLEQGMRVVLPDAARQRAVDLARTQILLDPDPDPAVTAALEDWGNDAEAAWAWRGLSLLGRRAARRRRALLESADGPAGLLLRTRAALVRDDRGAIELLDSPEWRGVDLEVHDAPTRFGRVSFAVRWHGERPAMLWEVHDAIPGFVVRAPALDPGWSETAVSGDALLSALGGVELVLSRPRVASSCR